MQAQGNHGRRTQRGAAAGKLLLIVVIGFLLWWFRPWERFLPEASKPDAIPRAVAARGTLAEDEQNNIAVFKTVSPSVVHITTLAGAASSRPTSRRCLAAPVPASCGTTPATSSPTFT
jgi:hypothetical protein